MSLELRLRRRSTSTGSHLVHTGMLGAVAGLHAVDDLRYLRLASVDRPDTLRLHDIVWSSLPALPLRRLVAEARDRPGTVSDDVMLVTAEPYQHRPFTLCRNISELQFGRGLLAGTRACGFGTIDSQAQPLPRSAPSRSSPASR